jgi:predicted DNA-binding protein with PD1-like motif
MGLEHTQNLAQSAKFDGRAQLLSAGGAIVEQQSFGFHLHARGVAPISR